MYNPFTNRNFGDGEKHLDAQYFAYRKIYNLPTLQLEDRVPDRSLFEYCQARKYFTIVLPYTDEGDLLLTPDLFSNKLTWKMFGGSVKPIESEDFVQASIRLVEEVAKGTTLGEIEPIAFLENKFHFESAVHKHLGVAFIGRMRSDTSVRTNDTKKAIPGHLVNALNYLPSIEHSYHAKILELSLPRIQYARSLRSQELEVKSNQKNLGRYKAHNLITKPLLRVASRFFGKTSIRDLEHLIVQKVLVKGVNSVVDVGCGENSKLINSAIVADIPLILGADIAWSHINLMQEKKWLRPLRDSNSVLLFMNHDARRLPYADKSIDVALCKNVIHHMPDVDSARLLVSEVRRVAKRSVFVEIMDPEKEGRWGRFRKNLYEKLLREPVGNMLLPQSFDELMHPPSLEEKFSVETVRGVYMFAIFDK